MCAYFLQFMCCSVEGLSVHMFILAILGNLTYGLGILLYSVNGIFLLQKLPWLIGSIGTLCFDITVSFLNRNDTVVFSLIVASILVTFKLVFLPEEDN